MAWQIHIPKAEFYALEDPKLESIIREVADTKVVAIDTETTGLTIWKDMPLFWSLAWGNRRLTMPAATLPHFRRVLADPDKWWLFANAKYDMHILANAGFSITGTIIDTQVMHCLLYEEEPHALDYMGKQLLGFSWKDLFEGWDKKKESVGDFLLRTFREDPQKIIEYASNDAFGTLKIFEKLRIELEEAWCHSLYPEYYKNLWDIFLKTEAPFTRVLWQCERNGIYVNKELLQRLEGPVELEMNELKKEINTLWQSFKPGTIMNPNSNPQKQEWFFGHEGRRPHKMSKGGKTGVKRPVCDADFLDDIKGESPMAKLLLRFADLSKLHGTYIVGLQKSDSVDPAGYLHTRFNQDVARTGRLSSSGPNL